jgi:hypothetical protein
MDTGLVIESEEQRVEREAKDKAEHDQQAEMEAKAKADQETQEPLPQPPFKPLAEQSFMQYMQFMQETQNKFMQELLGQVGAGRVPEARGISLSNFLNAKPFPFALAVKPMDAEVWLMDTERKMKAVGANDEEKVRYATHLLSGPAASWWDNEVTLSYQKRCSLGKSSRRSSILSMCLIVLWN